MLNLFEMMQKAQNGAAVDAMAKQFDLSPKQAENAVDVLLPAFALALQRQMQNPQLWPTFFAAMQPPSGTPGLDAGRALTAEGMRQGAEWMERLFGTSDLSRQVAVQAAATSGLPASMLQQMMPAMATMLMSGMLKTFSQQGFAGIIDAIGRAMQAGVTPPPAPPPAPEPTEPSNPFTAGLEAWSKILAAANPAAEPAPPPPEPKPEPAPSEPDPAPNPFDPAAFATMMGKMFGLPAAPEPAPPAEPEEPPMPEPAPAKEPAAAEDQATAAADEAAQAWSSFVETGREVQEQYMRNLQDLFGQMLTPTDKKG